jgi:hypothetical protein
MDSTWPADVPQQLADPRGHERHLTRACSRQAGQARGSAPAAPSDEAAKER